MQRLLKMNDTRSEMEKKMYEMIRLKSPEERLRMGCSMNETSRYLVKRRILEQHPNISDVELRRKMFLIFYGDEYSPETRNKILNYLH